MREHLDTFRHLLRPNTLDVEAALTALNEMPVNAGAEAAVVVAQARRSIAAVRAGKKRYRPLLRHAVGRLIVLLDQQVAVAASRSS